MAENSTSVIITSDDTQQKPLPEGTYIKLANNMGYMRLRKTRSVLRMHKYGRDDAQKQMYSDILFYHPFQEEKELPINDFDKCVELFSEMDPGEERKPLDQQRTKIQKVKEKLFPFKRHVEEARDLLKDLPDSRPQHLCDQLDPENEMENAELAAEGIVEAEEFAARDPGIMPNDGTSSSLAAKDMYRRIDISNKNQMRRSARQLDKEQRMGFDEYIKFSKMTTQSVANPVNKMPKPANIVMHGGAGTGKSKVIDDISSWSEFWLRVDINRDPSHPQVIKVAPTGRAAKVIKGLTIHSAFGMNFGNKHMSLGDTIRDIRRTQLTHLRIVIIDEMSMVKADMLYQLDLRLQEVMQSDEVFGGVSVLLSGDLMQLKPVQAKWIFEEPAGKDFKIFHSSNPLWEQFQAIELVQNHRQGEDKIYADILNRMRVGENTEEDFRVLSSRVNSEDPADAWFFFGWRKMVHGKNITELNQLNTALFSFKARHSQNSLIYIDEFGLINDTAFHDQLDLKVGARVMLIHNTDLGDGLINGSTGYVRGFMQSNGSQATDSLHVNMVLVEFDDEEDGRELRQKHSHILKSCPLKNVTPIARFKFEHGIGKSGKDHVAKNTIYQFPLTLAWAMTIHKCQGFTIHPPQNMKSDSKSCFQCAMFYVVCGRVQRLNQLYLSSFRREDIKVNAKALAEAKRITEKAKARVAENKFRMTWCAASPSVMKIASLNVQSFGGEEGHIADIKADHTLKEADVFCFSETWLPKGTLEGPTIDGYVSYAASYGRGAGVTVYLKDSIKIVDVRRIVKEEYQLLRLDLQDTVIIAAYRSPSFKTTNNVQHFSKVILDGTHRSKVNMVCGDMNIPFNPHNPCDNLLTSSLHKQGFVQLVKEATHIEGNILDHVYVRPCKNIKILQPLYELHYPYYSDHEAVLVMIKRIFK